MAQKRATLASIRTYICLLYSIINNTSRSDSACMRYTFF